MSLEFQNWRRRARLLAATSLLFLGLAQADPKPSSPWSETPVLAVWRHGLGLQPPRLGEDAAMVYALRYALWEDGRFIFARDPHVWQSPLREGRLTREEVDAVLAEAAATGVFELPDSAYLVPDAPVLSTLVRVKGKERLLQWDEVETAGYGINIDPKPHHLAFKKAWYALSRLLQRHLPKTSRPMPARFDPPRTWLLEKPVR